MAVLAISSFTGPCRFLSNFYPHPVELDGVMYPTVEHAYQAAKTFDVRQRHEIRNAASPAMAKRIGSRVLLREDWETVKLEVMKALLRQKFTEKNQRGRLLDTVGRDLIEGNWWGDRYWGVCRGVGENHLGKLLMEIRAELDATYGESHRKLRAQMAEARAEARRG